MAFIFGYSNLVAATDSTLGARQVNMTADWIVVDDGSGNDLRVPMTTTIPMDKNVTQTSTEANRRDTAGTWPLATWAGQWISIWAIYNPVTNTIAGLFSLSATAPTLPSGYTHKAWVGAVRNDSSGNFQSFYQNNNLVALPTDVLVASGVAPTDRSDHQLSLTGIIPPVCKAYILTAVALLALNQAGAVYCEIASGGGVAGRGRLGGGAYAPANGYGQFVGFVSGSIINDDPAILQFNYNLDTHYNTNAANTGWEFRISGWEY